MNEKNAVTPWFLYIIKTNKDTLYCGTTNNVERRYKEHSSQGAKCAKYLRGKGPLQLIFQCELPDKSTALKCEYKIKQLTKAQKLPLISGEIDIATFVE